jgi:hypothetical protein
MTRKEFLKFVPAAAVGGALVLTFANCKSNESTQLPDSKSFVGSTSQSHTHTVTIQRNDVESPPAAGISRSTSTSSGHTHTFTMTQEQLQAVNSGGTVTVTDSLVDGHTHNYVIQKWF